MKDEKKVKETEEKKKEIKEEQLKNVAGGKYSEQQVENDYMNAHDTLAIQTKKEYIKTE